MTLKKSYYNIFFKKYRYALKYHENAFFIVGIVKARIIWAGSESGSVTFYLSKRIRIQNSVKKRYRYPYSTGNCYLQMYAIQSSLRLCALIDLTRSVTLPAPQYSITSHNWSS
jgi:hypothetical protein